MPQETSRLVVRGDFTVTVTDRRTGRIVQTASVRNKIMQGGLDALPFLLANRSADPLVSTRALRSLRVGTGTVPPAMGDTALVAAVAGGAVALTDSALTPSSGTLTIRATLPEALNTSPIALSEAGLFLSDGTMFARQVHATITTGPGLQLDYTWVLTFTA